MRPFRDIDLERSLNSNKQKMVVKVDSFKNEEIMANDLEILAGNLYEEFRIEPVEIIYRGRWGCYDILFSIYRRGRFV